MQPPIMLASKDRLLVIAQLNAKVCIIGHRPACIHAHAHVFGGWVLGSGGRSSKAWRRAQHKSARVQALWTHKGTHKDLGSHTG